MELFIDMLKKIQYGLDNSMTLKELTSHYGVCDDYFYNYIRRGLRTAILDGRSVSRTQADKFIEKYELLKAKKSKVKNEILSFISAESSVEDDNNVYGESIRNSDTKRISHYEYSVKDRNGNIVKGDIDRDSMNKIYQLYSVEGNNLTQRTVSRTLLDKLDIDFHLFQKILKVFNITKASIPFAPHVLEENTVGDALDITFREKERLFFKRIEGDKLKKLSERNLELLAENQNLKNNLSDVKNWVRDFDWNDKDIEPLYYVENPDSLLNRSKTLVVILSDLHIGAMVSDDSIFENKYDKDEVKARFVKILGKIHEMYNDFGQFDNIIVVNLGDALDGFDNQTARGGHFLPQNLTNKEQFEFYVTLLKEFVYTLNISNYSDAISFYSVECGNHDGLWGWSANRLLEEYFKVKYPDMVCQVFNKAIDFINVGKHTLLFFHGKDEKLMFKNYPLYLDDKTENKINEILDEYFDSSLYSQNVIFIKGDLHQSGNSFGKRFQYKSVGSIFGSSQWSAINLGRAKPVCEFLVLDREDKNSQYETRLVLK